MPAWHRWIFKYLQQPHSRPDIPASTAYLWCIVAAKQYAAGCDIAMQFDQGKLWSRSGSANTLELLLATQAFN